MTPTPSTILTWTRKVAKEDPGSSVLATLPDRSLEPTCSCQYTKADFYRCFSIHWILFSAAAAAVTFLRAKG
jgi:hypothetical protein